MAGGRIGEFLLVQGVGSSMGRIRKEWGMWEKNGEVCCGMEKVSGM